MTAKACLNVGAAILWLAAGLGATAWGYHSETFFAAPYSGQKVNRYEVNLPVSRDEKRVFEIPGECDAAMAALAEGASRWCSRLEKRVWQKVASDCDYYAFIHRHVPTDIRDAISGYDFRNAAIADLLVSFVCGGEDGCAFGSQPVPDIAPLLSFAEPADDLSRYDAASCRLAHGSFRGFVFADDNGLRCVADPLAPGIRVLSVDYADVNGDGWLDAVLRVVPIGPGGNRRPLLLSYTRIDEDAPLGVPVGVSPQVPADEAPSQP